MKKITFYFIILILLYNISFCQVNPQVKNNLEGTITISGAFALYPMTVKWAEEFKNLHPRVRIDLSAGGAGKGMTDVLSKMVDIGMVSRDIYPEEVKKGAFAIAVTKDAVVATFSSSNPQLIDILKHGIKQDAANSIWITGKYKTWGQVVGIKSSTPIHVYTRSDACGAAESWAKFLGEKQEDLLGVGVFGDPGLAQAIRKDPLGIGYNNIAYAYDSKTKQPNPGIKILPIDLNNNGKIDVDENFYNTLDEIVTAIASGKYPSPPARDLYFVTLGQPKNKVVVEFVKWVLTEGQKYIYETGYINLPEETLNKELTKVQQ